MPPQISVVPETEVAGGNYRMTQMIDNFLKSLESESNPDSGEGQQAVSVDDHSALVVSSLCRCKEEICFSS